MERWGLAECRSKDGYSYYLTNRARTTMHFSPGAKNFNVFVFLDKLSEVGFPLRFTNGLTSISFTTLREDLGWYSDGEVYVDVKKKRRLKTIVETFVHEVAHHVDFRHGSSEKDKTLTSERKRRGSRIHRYAMESDEEYFARGFERYYSIDPRDRKDLKLHHPHLYRRIRALHRKYSTKPRVS